MGVPIRAVLSLLNLAAIISHLPMDCNELNAKATYISLVQFTDKGIHAAKEMTQQVAEWAAKVQSKGVTLEHMYWTLGHYDQICVFEAPNDETAASVLLPRTCWATFGRRRYVLLPALRWRRFSRIFPDRSRFGAFPRENIALAISRL